MNIENKFQNKNTILYISTVFKNLNNFFIKK